MKAELITATNSFFTIDIGNIAPEAWINAYSACYERDEILRGRTLEGCYFSVPAKNIDCVLIYEEDQVLEQHRRITRNRIARRQIEKELSPFEDIE